MTSFCTCHVVQIDVTRNDAMQPFWQNRHSNICDGIIIVWCDALQCHLNIALIFQAGFDVFNALDLMDNTEFLEKLKFGIGDGNLQYYLYNWKCPLIEPGKVGWRLELNSCIFLCIKVIQKHILYTLITTGHTLTGIIQTPGGGGSESIGYACHIS